MATKWNGTKQGVWLCTRSMEPSRVGDVLDARSWIEMRGCGSFMSLRRKRRMQLWTMESRHGGRRDTQRYLTRFGTSWRARIKTGRLVEEPCHGIDIRGDRSRQRRGSFFTYLRAMDRQLNGGETYRKMDGWSSPWTCCQEQMRTYTIQRCGRISGCWQRRGSCVFYSAALLAGAPLDYVIGNQDHDHFEVGDRVGSLWRIWQRMKSGWFMEIQHSSSTCWDSSRPWWRPRVEKASQHSWWSTRRTQRTTSLWQRSRIFHRSGIGRKWRSSRRSTIFIEWDSIKVLQAMWGESRRHSVPHWKRWRNWMVWRLRENPKKNWRKSCQRDWFRRRPGQLGHRDWWRRWRWHFGTSWREGPSARGSRWMSGDNMSVRTMCHFVEIAEFA